MASDPGCEHTLARFLICGELIHGIAEVFTERSLTDVALKPGYQHQFGSAIGVETYLLRGPVGDLVKRRPAVDIPVFLGHHLQYSESAHGIGMLQCIALHHKQGIVEIPGHICGLAHKYVIIAVTGPLSHKFWNAGARKPRTIEYGNDRAVRSGRTSANIHPDHIAVEHAGTRLPPFKHSGDHKQPAGTVFHETAA